MYYFICDNTNYTEKRIKELFGFKEQDLICCKSFEDAEKEINSKTGTISGIIVMCSEGKGIEWVRDTLRTKLKLKCPVVFVDSEERNYYGRHTRYEIVNTFGLGHAYYRIGYNHFDFPEDYHGKKDITVYDFLKKRKNITDIQFQDLMSYCRPVEIVSRLKHDYTYDKESSIKKLISLTDDYGLREDVEKKYGECTQKKLTSVSHEELFEFVRECITKKGTGTSPTSSHGFNVLILDDNSGKIETCLTQFKFSKADDIDSFLSEKKRYLVRTTVKEAEDVISRFEKFNKRVIGLVIVCDLRLKSENGLLNDKQGYELLDYIKNINYRYGVIIVSSLQRDFKTYLAQRYSSSIKVFPYRHKLTEPYFQQMFYDELITSYCCAQSDSTRDAFANNEDALRKYYDFLNDISNSQTDTEAKKLIESFLTEFHVKEWKINYKNQTTPVNHLTIESFRDRLVMRRFGIFLCFLLTKAEKENKMVPNAEGFPVLDNTDKPLTVLKQVESIIQKGKVSAAPLNNSRLSTNYWFKWRNVEPYIQDEKAVECFFLEEERHFFNSLWSNEDIKKLIKDFIDKKCVQLN